MRIEKFSTRSLWQEGSLQFVLTTVQSIIANKGYCRLALSGGNTPRWLYEQLAMSALPLDAVEVFQVDERYVAQDSIDLNANMLKAAFMKDAKPFKAFHFFDVSLGWEEAATRYDELLESLSEPLFDLIILGVGVDGHTASLFPHCVALHSKQLVLTTTTDVFVGRHRLTLTPIALNKAASILILATGKDKQGVVSQFEDGVTSMDELPIMCVRDHANVVMMFGDF